MFGMYLLHCANFSFYFAMPLWAQWDLQNHAKHYLFVNRQKVLSMTIESLLKWFLLHQETLLNSFQWKEFAKKLAILVFDPAISVLNKHLTLPIKDVLSFKDSADKKFEMLLKALFNLSGSSLQPAFTAISVCQTTADSMNNQHDPVFQDHAVAQQLQQLPSALLFCEMPWNTPWDKYPEQL